MDVPASLLDFSLVRGDPLVRLGRWRHLARPRRPSLLRRILFVLLVSWLPLLVLSLLHGGPAVTRAFLLDVLLQVRLLVSLPMLIAAEPYIDASLATAVRQFVSSKLIGAKHLAAFEDIARGVMRLRKKASVEAGLLLAAYALSFVDVPLQASPDWLLTEPGGRLSLAGWWYLWLSLPLLRFLLLRWLWRSALWTVFLFRVSRLPLALLPTHPDATGGLYFLSTCQASFSVIVFAVSCPLTAQYLQRHPSGDLNTIAIRLLAVAIVSFFILFAPLLPFSPQLLAAKRRGDYDFSVLAAWHSRHFERRWFHREEATEQEPLGAPDFSSLTDLDTTFDAARRMRWFPVSLRAVLAILCAAMAPMLPLLFIDRRFLLVVVSLGKLLF